MHNPPNRSATDVVWLFPASLFDARLTFYGFSGASKSRTISTGMWGKESRSIAEAMKQVLPMLGPGDVNPASEPILEHSGC